MFSIFPDKPNSSFQFSSVKAQLQQLLSIIKVINRLRKNIKANLSSLNPFNPFLPQVVGLGSATRENSQVSQEVQSSLNYKNKKPNNKGLKVGFNPRHFF